MGALLTGIKPIRNTLNLLTFATHWREHRALLRTLRTVDAQFARDFETRPLWRRGANVVIVATFISFVTVGIVRAAEFYTTLDLFGPDIPVFAWASLVLAPMLAVWQLLPLFYFTFLCVLVRRWFIVLTQRMNEWVFT